VSNSKSISIGCSNQDSSGDVLDQILDETSFPEWHIRRRSVCRTSSCYLVVNLVVFVILEFFRFFIFFKRQKRQGFLRIFLKKIPKLQKEKNDRVFVEKFDDLFISIK